MRPLRASAALRFLTHSGHLFTAADEEPAHNVLIEKDGYAYFTASKDGQTKFGRVRVGYLKYPSWYKYWGGRHWVSN